MKGSIPSIRIVCRSNNPEPSIQVTNPIASSKGIQEDEAQTFQFRDKLDTRDEEIKVPFRVKMHAKSTEEQLRTAFLEWMAVVVENILSVTFRYILQSKLTILEGKAFAAKNILLNIKLTCQSIHQNLDIQINQDFIEFIDRNLKEICEEAIKKYPQTNTKGASNKLKAFIKKISNRENDQYDLLRNNGISIHYNNNGDYSSDIMNVINRIIDLPQDTQVKDSLFQEFQTFCSELFFSADKKMDHQSSFISINMPAQFPSLQDLEEIQQFQKSRKNRTSAEDRQALKHLKELESAHAQQRTKLEACEEIAKTLIESKGEMDEELLKFKEKKGNLFAIGQKISSEVKTFTDKEIRSGRFRVHHSAILRVMTKWSQELYKKISQASQKIRHRVHKFKTSSMKLRFCQVEEKEYLYQIASEEKVKVDKYFKNLEKQNKELQSFFSTQHFEGMYLKKYTNVNIYAGRIEEILGQLTFKYLNRLIHSLLTIPLEAGERICQDHKIYHNDDIIGERKKKALNEINLISLKIGDLIRARYVCHEHQFSNILAILYKIEETDPDFLKIVKIKNRLDDKSNDILINLFFKNKVLCQLQLGIFKEENFKEKLYSQFNHFIYELIRSDFGVLSALSNVIAQHDPIVNFFIFNQHKPPKTIKRVSPPSKHGHRKESLKLGGGRCTDVTKNAVSYSHLEKDIEKPFICKNCRNLRIVHNIKFYSRAGSLQEFCNECIERMMKEAPQKCNSTIQSLFRFYVLDEKIEQFMEEIEMWFPGDVLSNVRDEKELFSKFLEFGFIIEKGEKIPKVKFFKKTFNPMNNEVVLSTISGGKLDNFLSISARQQKGRFFFMEDLKKYIFFAIRSYNTKLQIFYEFADKEYLEIAELSDIKYLIRTDEHEILKSQHMKYIDKSFEKYHPTLYLNNYKFILRDLQERIDDRDQNIRSKKEGIFRLRAIHIYNLELESTQITQLCPVLSCFVNLKEINLSTNYLLSLKGIEDLTKLQKINVSSNKLSDINPLAHLPNLACIIAAHNLIEKLPEFGSPQRFQMLNFSYNILTSLRQLQAFLNLEELNVTANYLESTKGISNLVKLESLYICANQLEIVEQLESLVNLVELGLEDNKLGEIPSLQSYQKLQKFDISNNYIKEIRLFTNKRLKEIDLSRNQIACISNLHNLPLLQILNLQENKINKIEGFQETKKLRVLNLGSNSIKVIENLHELKSLEYLKLTNNPIEELQELQHLKNINKLDINSCRFFMVKNLQKLKKLRTLNLSKNRLEDIEDIYYLVRVQKLDLRGNCIKEISHLCSLKYLQSLSLMDNQIAKIQNLQNLSELKWIILSRNCISRLQNLQDLESLSILQIQYNLIKEIQNLDKLSQLEEVWLSFNQISQISNLHNLPQLKKLGLAHNRIKKIEGLSGLINLEFLDLQANYIQKIQNFDRLSQLRWLVLSLNRLTKLQNLSELTQLQTLIAEHNQIETIQNLQRQRQLLTLILSYNRIAQIEGLNSLQNLQKLHLSNNRIARIKGLDSQSHIRELILNNNQIQKIENISHMERLKVLNLSHNRIAHIEEIDKIQCLRMVELEGNLIETFSKRQVSQFIDEINLANNPIQDRADQHHFRSSLRFYFNPLLAKFDQNTSIRQTIQKKHSEYYLARSNPRIHPKLKETKSEEEEELELKKCGPKRDSGEQFPQVQSSLVRFFTKKYITSL